MRLEDVDPSRCTPQSADDMRAALDWLGLDWDGESLQSERRAEHEVALDRLARAGLVYPCVCSRTIVRRAGTPAADGGWRYPGHCRERALPPGGWRACGEALRLRLPAGDGEGGEALREMGDPVLRRRDGALAYHLVCVVDDDAQGITRVVRGRDLEPSTAIHLVLQRELGFDTPAYRHHLLLLEESGGKLAKLHGAVGWHEIREQMDAAALCGVLAHTVGLRDSPEPTTPRDLLVDFDWERVAREDKVMRWTGSELVQVA